MGVKIREKPSGSGEWWVFIDHQGKRKSKKIGKDKKLAKEVASKIEAKLVLGDTVLEKPKITMPVFSEVAELWIAQPHDWKDSTCERYRDNLKIHAYPVFGRTPIDQITKRNLKMFFDRKYTEGSKLNSIRLIRAPMSGVLSYAVSDLDLMDHNPMRDVSFKYKKSDFEVEPLTESESILLLDQARTFSGGIYYPVVLCGLRTGMRIGEIQALQWRDIDFERRAIEVRHSWQLQPGKLTTTKNKKRRRVDMTPNLAEVLQNHKTNQKRKALRDGQPFSEFVFTGQRDEMLNRVSFRYALDKCTEKARLRKIRTHDLRHTYATIRLMRGHNVGDVSYQLGHSSIKITYDVYCHWIPGQFKSEVDELDKAQPSAPYTQPEKAVV